MKNLHLSGSIFHTDFLHSPDRFRKGIKNSNVQPFNSFKIMKSDNLIQLSGFLTKDVITNEKKSFAAFTIGRKVGDDTFYMNCIAFPSQKSKIPFEILAKGNEVFVAGYLRPNNYTKDGVKYNAIQLVAEKIRETDENLSIDTMHSITSKSSRL